MTTIITRKISPEVVARICNGNATREDYKDLGLENVLSVKSDPYLPRRRMLQKAVPSTANKEDRTVEHEASNGTRDRMGDVIDPRGWMLDNFRSNPQLLWMHDDFLPPLGRVLRARKGPVDEGRKALVTTSRFHDQEKNPFAELIWRYVSDGDLPAVSVGFLPLENGIVRPESEEQAKEMDVEWPWGVRFVSQELLELSVVTVPALATALARKADKLADEGAFSWALISDFKKTLAPKTKAVFGMRVDVPASSMNLCDVVDELGIPEIAPAISVVHKQDPSGDQFNALLREVRGMRQDLAGVLAQVAQAPKNRVDESARKANEPNKPAGQNSPDSRRKNPRKLYALAMGAAAQVLTQPH